MKRFLVVLLLLVVAAAVLVRFGLNGLVEHAVEAAGSSALGVKTELQSARIGVLSTDALLQGLKIENPEGFGPGPFLSLGKASFALSAPSLLGDVIKIPLVEFDDVALSLQQVRERSNAKMILDNLTRSEGGSGEKGGGGGGGGSKAGGGGKRFLIERIVLRNVNVNAQVDLLGNGKASSTNLLLHEVDVRDVGTGGEGAPLSDVLAEIVKGLLSATVDADRSNILNGSLHTSLEEGLKGLRSQAKVELEDKVQKSLGGVLDGQSKEVQEGANSLLEGLGGKKKKD